MIIGSITHCESFPKTRTEQDRPVQTRTNKDTQEVHAVLVIGISRKARPGRVSQVGYDERKSNLLRDHERNRDIRHIIDNRFNM